ncbi:hypothetical protein ACFL2H_11980 [Planctomycetota bacterium]
MYRITAFIALLMIGLPVHAQSPTDEPGDSAQAPRVKENPLSILYARDTNGKYVPLLNGVGYEEINRFLVERISRSERAKPNRVTMSNLEITGVLEPTLTRMNQILESLQRTLTSAMTKRLFRSTGTLPMGPTSLIIKPAIRQRPLD